MLRCLKYELHKLFCQKKFFLLVVFCVLLFAILLAFEVHNTNNSFYAVDYKNIYEKIEDYDFSEALDYLDKQAKKIETLLLVEEYEWEITYYGTSETTEQLKEKILQAQKEYGNIMNEKQDFDALRKELSAIQAIQNEILLNSEYYLYLENIQIAAQNLQEVSIFENQTGFSSANIKKTANDMKKMQDVSISLGSQKGVMLFTNHTATDVLAFFVILILIYFIFFDEKENGLYYLTKTTPLGTTKTYFAKITTLFISVFLLWCVLYLITTFFATTYYGIGNIHRSIQSIVTFYGSNIKISVLGMLCILFVFRVFGSFIAGLILMLITMKATHSVFFVFFSLIIGGVNYILTLISPQSFFCFLKYINLYTLFNPEIVLSEYINLNLFKTPVNLKPIIVVFGCFMIIISILIGIFSYKKDFEKTHIIKLPRFSNKLLFVSYKSLVALEFHKMRILNKTTILIIVYIMLQIFLVNNSQYYIGPEEYYYLNYMDILQGEITDKKIDFIQKEKHQIDLLEEKNATLNNDYANGQISLSELQAELSKNNLSTYRQNAFQRVYTQYEYIQMNSEAHFLYDSGYRILLGIDAQHYDFWYISAVMLCIMSILCIGNVFSQEHSSGVIILLHTVKKGTTATLNAKIIVSCIISTIVYIITYVPRIIEVVIAYGSKNIFSPLSSISAFAEIGNCSILGGLLISFGIRYIISLSVTLILLGISNKTKRSIYSIAFAFFVFVLPLLIHKFGINVFDYVSLYTPLVMNNIITGQDIFVVVLLCFLYISLAIISYCKLYKNSKN